MIFGKTAWGIDIGKTAIKAVKVAETKGTVEIRVVDALPLPAGPDVDEDTRDLVIRDSLAEFLKRHKIGLEPVCLSVPGQMMLNRFFSLPPVQEKRIPEIVRYEARQLIPFPLEDIIWDFHIIGGGKGVVEREAALFAVKEDVVRAALRAPVSVNFPVDMMQVGSLAAYNFIQFDRRPQEAIAILDLGAVTTDLIILDGEKFWLRNLSIAGNDITEAFQEKFGMTFVEAEELKQKAGESKQAEKILDVMTPVLRDLVAEVQRSMGFYKSQSAGVKFSKILLMGNAANQAGLLEFLQENLEYDIEVVTSLERIVAPPTLSPELWNETTLKGFSVAIGLALQGLGKAAIKVNLLPHDVAFIRQIQRKKPFVAAAVGFLVLAVLLSFVSANKLLMETEETLGLIEDFVEDVDRLDHDYSSAKRDVDPVREEIEKLGTLGKKRLPWADILSNITRCASAERMWVTSLTSELRIRVVEGKDEEKDRDYDRERRERSEGPGGPGGLMGPGGPGGPGGWGGGSSSYSSSDEDVKDVIKDLHFILEGATEQLETRYILDEVVIPLRSVPEFRDVDLVKTVHDEVTIEAVRIAQDEAEVPLRAKMAGLGRRQGRRKTGEEEKVLEELRPILRFTIEWDYIPVTEEEIAAEEAAKARATEKEAPEEGDEVSDDGREGDGGTPAEENEAEEDTDEEKPEDGPDEPAEKPEAVLNDGDEDREEGPGGPGGPGGGPG